MKGALEVGRYELKYVLPVRRRNEVLDLIAPYVHPDPYARPLPDGALGYHVHSLYLDTPELADYFERLERRKIRNRLRVRTYGHEGDGQPVFLENKRKSGRWVVKQRVPVCDAETWCSADEARPWAGLAGSICGKGEFVVRSFCQLVDGGGRVPVSVVHYRREVYLPREDRGDHVRLTLDRRVRAGVVSCARELYAPAKVDLIPEDWMVMELKFNRFRPAWMLELCRSLGVLAVPVTKFGLSIAKGRRAGRDAELRLLMPPPIVGSRRVA